jgi:guanylate kinase
MIANDELLEWAEVFGNYYGTARRFLEEAAQCGKDLLLDIDVQGATQVKQKLLQAVSVFILPPSRSILEFRLRNPARMPRKSSENGCTTRDEKFRAISAMIMC